MLNNRTDLVHDGDCTGVAVFGLPRCYGAVFEIDISHLQAPQFAAAESCVEEDEERVELGLVAEHGKCLHHLVFFFCSEEAYPVQGFLASRDFHNLLNNPSIYCRGEHLGKDGKLSIDC